MNLVLEEENDSIVTLKGKKRQRIVNGPLALLGSNTGKGSLDLSASSVNGTAHPLTLEGQRRKVYDGWVNGMPESVMMVAMKDRLAWN
ncbi:hypothetical protein PVK06_021439 [Gossypium arboreum]|uniref:LSM domain-containing protein n=1 Tax=Gossypium arboreum TaxID=29729 RepID=A0ABR0PQ07_GOSAR|nr:hypothetical protein PVK06_021439 [Gossypium arboreum]